MKKPLIVVPMGDPAGIGPEIVVKALASGKTWDKAVCTVVGDKNVLSLAMKVTGVNLEFNIIDNPLSAEDRPGIVNLINIEAVDMNNFEWGRVSSMGGKAAFEFIKKSVALAMAGEADAVSTTPINKESLRAAGIPYIGHTEIFAALTGTEDPLTMFETRGMRVFFLTRHVSLRNMLDMRRSATGRRGILINIQGR